MSGLRAWCASMVVGVVTGLTLAFAPAAVGAPDERAFFFASGEALELKLAITDDSVEKLRRDARVYVPVTLIEGGKEVARGGVKLKGAAGSFREVDDRPAFTINLGKFEAEGAEARGFHGLEKFHLNNSVQDESLLCEWLSAEIFRSAGYPAARVGHARVWLNDRDLGMYVLREGFDKAFLAEHFKNAKGNLYDGGFCQDLDAELERDLGKGPDDRADLKRVVAACVQEEPERRWKELASCVEIEAFVRFTALELIVGHWDGYVQNRNNYRVYFAPGEKGAGSKAWFIPHGMDQTFGDPGAGVLDVPSALVASSVMSNPAWRAAYRRELSRLAEGLGAEQLAKKIAGVQAKLQPAMKRIGDEAASAQADRARELVERVQERVKSVREQAARPEPKPMTFEVGEPVVVEGWSEASEAEDVEHGEAELDGTMWLRVACGESGRCVASWRRAVIVPRGRYRLEAEVKAEGVETLGEQDSRGVGAGVRISGAKRAEGVTGDERRMLKHEFQVDGDVEVVLVLELRASKGSVLFRKDSLKLVRISAEPAE